mmetsp:Transcript_17567/g.36594  ORF Transcript_17567/g.36594 Transcript_17567/m.36594 type:complete len:683 (+) Transcript_17567:48-2096(+)
MQPSLRATGAGPAAWALSAAALLLAAVATVPWPEEELLELGHGGDDACAAGSEGNCSLRLLQRRALQTVGTSLMAGQSEDIQAARKPRPRLFGKERADVLAGKSVYFVVIDRFARTDGKLKPCDSKKHWCGGTLKGITAELDYIKGMGFDALWITPVVKQYEGETKDGTGFMGYWAKDHYQIDPHYGTPQDLKDLVNGLHDRNMTFMLDIVVNHVGPVHSSKDVVDLHPFNKIEHFHTLDIGDHTFDQYTKPMGMKPASRPLQAMWSGGQCRVGEDCNCFTCEPLTKADFMNLPPPAWDACPYGKMVWNASSPCPWDSLSAFCMPGDFKCKGYDEKVTLDGWFYDLGDLNQSVPFVREGLKNWTRWLVETYDIDMLRLDTAGFVPFDFLNELQENAGVPIIGEVTATNMSYHASIEKIKDKTGIDGVLNFPLYYTAQAAFCHTWFPKATGNLTFLGERMIEQAKQGLYANLDTLGNFIDNHDVDRLHHSCKGDVARMLNSMAWVMLSKGMPIIYYGTEDSRVHHQRESMWNYNYTHGRGYEFLARVNALRKEYDLGTSEQVVRIFIDRSKLTITRGRDQSVWVYLNNMESGDSVTRYCSNLPQAAKPGYVWTNYFTGQAAQFDNGCLIARDNIPVILVQRQEADIIKGNVSSWDDKFSNGSTEEDHRGKGVFDPYNVYQHSG